jgi:hypothetical protein
MMRIAMVGLLLLSACSRPAADQPAADGLPDFSGTPYAQPSPPAPTPAARAGGGDGPVLQILSETGMERDGQLVVDALEGDRLYLGVALESESGRPLPHEPVSILGAQQAQLIRGAPQTDAEGYLEFQLIAGTAGRETLQVSAAGVTREFILNVRPSDYDQWLAGIPTKGLTSWKTLMQTRVEPEGENLRAVFPPEVQRLGGQKVRVAGFMLPLEPTPGQTHFLLSANPPNCFFHVPGGPSTVAEVFAPKAITGTFDPLVIEGWLELVAQNELGIVYQIRDARLVR